jgi:LmbE family N-acetylglucosaminyl deacetylase
MSGTSPEERLVPYRASAFEARRVLVFAPHADDEVFGCGAALAALAARGAAVTVVVLTDGAGDAADAGERGRIAATRVAESRAALAALGGGEVRGVGFRDRRLGDDPPALRAALLREIGATRPDLVFVPSPVEIHPDHRALAAAFVALAAAGEPALADATVAFYEVSQPIRPNFLFDCGPFAEAKARAGRLFISQNGARDYTGYMAGLNSYRRMTLPGETTGAEGYWVISAAALAGVSLAGLAARMGPSADLPQTRLSIIERLRVLLTGVSPGPSRSGE